MDRYPSGIVLKFWLESSPRRPENATYSLFRGLSSGVTWFAESLYRPAGQSAAVTIGQRV